jgi:chromosome segregation ATPase
MADALLDEVLESNLRNAEENKRLKEENKRLKEYIARNESEISFLETFIEELQSTIAFLTNELDETNTQTMEAMRLMARNLDQAKKELVLIKQKNEVLHANQEIHMGVIDDLKGEILEEKMEKNQMEKQCKNTTALFASFEPQPHQEPIVMECFPIPSPATGYLDNYRATTHC